MSINAIGTGVQNEVKIPAPATKKEQQNAGDPLQVNKLNAEIKQAEVLSSIFHASNFCQFKQIKRRY